MPVKTLETLFHDALTDIYSAERKILKSLPKMERATQAPASKAVFSTRENKNERLHKANLQEKSQAPRSQGRRPINEPGKTPRARQPRLTALYQ